MFRVDAGNDGRLSHESWHQRLGDQIATPTDQSPCGAARGDRRMIRLIGMRKRRIMADHRVPLRPDLVESTGSPLMDGCGNHRDGWMVRGVVNHGS